MALNLHCNTVYNAGITEEQSHTRIIMSCGCFGASTLKKKRSPPHTPNEIDGEYLF